MVTRAKGLGGKAAKRSTKEKQKKNTKYILKAKKRFNFVGNIEK